MQPDRHSHSSQQTNQPASQPASQPATLTSTSFPTNFVRSEQIHAQAFISLGQFVCWNNNATMIMHSAGSDLEHSGGSARLHSPLAPPPNTPKNEPKSAPGGSLMGSWAMRLANWRRVRIGNGWFCSPCARPQLGQPQVMDGWGGGRRGH